MVNIRRRHVASAAGAALLALTVIAIAAQPPGPRSRGGVPPTPTVEPTLPIAIDLRFEDVERAGARARGRLVIEIRADDAVGDLSLETTLPAGVVVDGPEERPRGPLALRAGESRRFVVSLAADGAGRRAVRVEATFRDPMGRLLRLGQGIDLAPPAPDAGRSHLGAWEVMAVPVEQVRR